LLSLLPVLVPVVARADEFAVIPAGDPVYGNLSAVARFAPPSRATGKVATSMTRYEAALQTARILLSLSIKENSVSLSRDNARVLKELVAELRPELRQLDSDPDAANSLIDRIANHTPAPRTVIAATPATGLPRPALAIRPSLPSAGLSLGSTSSPDRREGASLDPVSLSLSRRLRASAALLAMQRETDDPFGDAADGAGLLSHGPASRLSSVAAAGLSYDFNSWLRVRAASETRNLTGTAATGSLLSAPMFNGSDSANASGGGVDVSLGNLRFSTDVSRLSGSNGNAATAVGGGVGLNAWQNRLSLSAHMAHLDPEDSAALAATAAELNIGVDVTRRFSLNMQYQGLFTEQRANNNARVAGGLTLNF
jgi:hypothetical protein